MSFEGIWGVVVFCILSHKRDRLKVIRARPEITVTEYNPCMESLKKEEKTAQCVCMKGGKRSC